MVGRGIFVVMVVVSGSSSSSMFIFRRNSRAFRCSAMALKGSETDFAWQFSSFFGSSTSSMFIFRGNSRALRWSRMVLNGVFIIKRVPFRSFGSSTSWTFIFGGNSRFFSALQLPRCSFSVVFPCFCGEM